MVIIWEVDNGYVCGSRPQETEINDDEFIDFVIGYNPFEEAMDFLEDRIEEDFQERITWHIKK